MTDYTELIQRTREATCRVLEKQPLLNQPWYESQLGARLAADLAHLAEHEAAEAESWDEVRPNCECGNCTKLVLLRRRTEQIADLLEVKHG